MGGGSESGGVAELPAEQATHLTRAYATQLEAMGLFDWATFVVQHVGSPPTRKQLVYEMLERHATIRAEEMLGEFEFCESAETCSSGDAVCAKSPRGERVDGQTGEEEETVPQEDVACTMEPERERFFVERLGIPIHWLFDGMV